MRQTKLASSLVKFRAHHKIVWLYFFKWQLCRHVDGRNFATVT